MPKAAVLIHAGACRGKGIVVYYSRESDPPVLFAGDLLMAGSVGRYDLPGDGDLPVLIKSLARVVALPKETVVLSGARAGRRRSGEEISGNPFLHEYGLAGE